MVGASLLALEPKLGFEDMEQRRGWSRPVGRNWSSGDGRTGHVATRRSSVGREQIGELQQQ